MRIREEIEGVTRSVASTREELTKQDVLYDHYQEKCADLRLQQQNWDAGIIDLLSKWQGWTDVTERSEAAHFEEEPMLMAQLITHQQSMAELSNLNDTSPPVGTTDSSWSSEAAVGGRQPLYKPNNSLSSGTTGSGWGSSAVIQPSGSGIRPLGSTIISGSRLFGSDDSKPSAWGPAPAPSQTQDAGHSAWGAQPSRNPGSTNAWGNVGSNGRANNSGLQDAQPSVWGGSNSMW